MWLIFGLQRDLRSKQLLPEFNQESYQNAKSPLTRVVLNSMLFPAKVGDAFYENVCSILEIYYFIFQIKVLNVIIFKWQLLLTTIFIK